MSVDLSSELNYNSVPSQHSSMRFSNVYPLSGSQTTITLGTSPQELTFELPNKCYNLANSSYICDLSLSGVVGATGDYQSLFTVGQQIIDRISLYTREGVYLCDIPNFNKFSRAVTPYVTSKDEFDDNDHSLGAAVAASAVDNGFNNFKNRAPTGVALVAGHGATIARVAAGGAAIEAGDIPYDGYQYQVTSTISTTSAGAGSTMYIKYSIPLSEIHHSLLSVNRVMYFGQSLLLRFMIAPTTAIGFKSSALVTSGLAAASLTATTVTLTNNKILLAVETNPVVITGLVNRVQSSGLQVITPYVYNYHYLSPSASQTSVNYRLNSAHGQRLLCAYMAVFNGTETGSTSSDISNVGSAKIVSMQTSLDNNNLQEYIPLCSANEDYQIMKPMLEGSVIQSSNEYKYNRLWCDSWRKGPISQWKKLDAVELDGLLLASERIYSANLITHATPAAYHMYNWFVTQRTLTIAPSGQIVVS